MVQSNQFPKKEKPKVGKLWYGDSLLLSNKPFRFLQYKKKELIARGYDKNLFKITY